jgi:hypothetical protein
MLFACLLPPWCDARDPRHGSNQANGGPWSIHQRASTNIILLTWKRLQDAHLDRHRKAKLRAFPVANQLLVAADLFKKSTEMY